MMRKTHSRRLAVLNLDLVFNIRC